VDVGDRIPNIDMGLNSSRHEPHAMQSASESEVRPPALRSRRLRTMRGLNHVDRHRFQFGVPGANHEGDQRGDKARMVGAGRPVSDGFEVLLNASDLVLNRFPPKQASGEVERLHAHRECLLAGECPQPAANRHRAHGVLSGRSGDGPPRTRPTVTKACQLGQAPWSRRPNISSNNA
jgi:hypothetical protein